MKKLRIPLSFLGLFLLLQSVALAAGIDSEIDLAAGEVAALKLGFGDYVLGRKLTDEQKEKAHQDPIDKSLKGTYKFRDGEIFIVATQDKDLVIGLYKEYPEITPELLKQIVGGLMFEYGEPTISAHDKMIYWIYAESGKIDQETFQINKDSGGSASLITVKFSSSERIGAEPKEGAEPSSAYLMITSDPLSKLFLAQTNQ